MKRFKKKGILLGGVDGCSKGWLVVFLESTDSREWKEEVFLFSSFKEILSFGFDLLAVDIPIGLPEESCLKGRVCDQEARKLLGPRACTIFNPPPRKILRASSYQEAKILCEGHLNRQTWNLVPKIKEVDEIMNKKLQKHVFETHPELVFLFLNQGALLPSKHSLEGQRLRLELLQKSGFKRIEDHLKLYPRFWVDLLDAYAAALAAKKIFSGQANRLPSGYPPVDSRGLRQEIWF